MPGAYFANPDCLEALPERRSIEELRERARLADPTEILVFTEPEFDLIKREVGLAYRWQGRRIFVL